jgi:hypothetical protein
MNWLKENSAAIQALASLAALSVAVILAWLTYRYVRLTRDIATSSLEQVKHIREAVTIERERHARALASLSLRIRTSFGGLNADVPRHKELRGYSQFTEREIADIEALARQVGGPVLDSASQTVASLRTMQDMIQKAKQINEVQGWIPTQQEMQAWRRAIESAHRGLQEIEAACQNVSSLNLAPR